MIVWAGYGFLSENTMFVAELEKAGVKFIGEYVLYVAGVWKNFIIVLFLQTTKGGPQKKILAS